MDARIVSNQVVNSLQVSILRDVPPGDFIPGLNFLIKNISDEDVEATPAYAVVSSSFFSR